MIKIDHLCKTYKNGRTKTNVLKDINLTINQGEFVSIVGPSGCGKTTLLNIVSGLDRQSEGKISIDGEDLEKVSDSRWAYLRRQKIGYVFQSFNLLDDFTVLENVELSLKLKDYDKEEGTKIAKELLDEVGLSERLSSKPAQLSGGQKQRVAIARALSGNPQILLADEPTGALDVNTAKEIMELLKRLCRERNMTIIMVTHDDALSREADRRIEMRDGAIVSDDRLNEVVSVASDREKTETRKAGKGASAMIAKRNIKTSKRKIVLTSLAMAIGVAATMVILGIGSGIKDFVNSQLSMLFDQSTIYASAGRNETFTDEMLEKVENIDGVKVVYPYYIFVGGYIISDEQNIPTYSKAVSISEESSDDMLIAGRLPVADSSKEIVISLQSAKELAGDNDVNSVIGKKVTFAMAKEGEDKKVNVAYSEVEICGIMQNTLFGLINCTIVPYETFFDIHDEVNGGRVNGREYTIVPEKISDIDVVNEKIKALGVNSELAKDSMGAINVVIDAITGLFVVFVSIALIIAGVMMAISFRMSIIEKTREIGILRALGFTKKDVRRVFLGEGAAVGLMGGVLGALSALIIGYFINVIAISKSIGSIFEISIVKLIICVILSSLWGIICVHSQARKASKLNPVEALFFVE